MKQIAPNYTFNPVAATVTLVGLSIGLDQLLGIFDQTTGVSLYNPDAPTLAPTILGSVITLNAQAPLTNAQSTDALLVIYDDQLSASHDGMDANGVSQLTGGIGIRGWLSGCFSFLNQIYTKLTGSIAVTGTFWQNTQPVSIASFALPTNASQETGGNLATIAGAISAAAMQTNFKQINSVTILAGSGATGTGSQRVTIAQDAGTIAGSIPGSAGAPATNVVTVQGPTAGGTAVPISAVSLPIPSGAATSANQNVTTAGVSAANAQAIQGVTGGIAVPVSQSTAANLNATVVGTGAFSVQLTGASNNVNVSTSAPFPVAPYEGGVTQTRVTLAANTSGILIAANATRKGLRWMNTGVNPMTVVPGLSAATVNNGMNYNGNSGSGFQGGSEAFEGSAIPTSAFQAISTLGTTVTVWEIN